MSEPYRLYWQPGCTSCLQTKEFLAARGIPFESINIAAQPETTSELAELGYRSVPVLARGSDAIACQDLRELAAFVDVQHDGANLGPEALIGRLDRLLQAACRHTRQLAPAELERHFVGRDRPFRDLAFHIFMIPSAFLAAAGGGRLEMAHFLETPPPEFTSGHELADFGESVRENLLAWYDEARSALPDEVDTYYGRRALHAVLERTAWHAAQHCRQLQAVLELFGHEPDGRLGEQELGDLPLPVNVFDDEIELAAAP